MFLSSNSLQVRTDQTACNQSADYRKLLDLKIL